MDAPNNFSISGLSRPEAFAKIDAEITRLQDQIHFLQDLRNQLAPITDIPSELLSKTFLHAQDTDEEDYFANGHSRLAVSAVSRHWRHVAIMCPRLWNLFSYQNIWWASMRARSTEYAQACFERSKDVDLSLSLYNPDTNLLEHCLSQLHRSRDIQIKTTPRGSGLVLNPLPHQLYEQPAPRLVSLYLQNFYFATHSNPDEDVTLVSASPQLRHLTLKLCEFKQWGNLPLTSGLTTLRVLRPYRKLPLDSYVGILSLVWKTLVECELVLCMYSNDFDIPPPTHNVTTLTLPKLRKFTIEDNLHPALGLLDRLDLPIASVYLTTQYGRSAEPWLRDMLNSLTEYGSRLLGRDDICHLSLRCEQSIIGITTSTSGFRTLSPGSSYAPREFTFSVPFYGPFQFDPLICVIDYLSLAHEGLRSLLMEGLSRERALYGLYQSSHLEVVEIRSTLQSDDSDLVKMKVLRLVKTLAEMHPPSTVLPSLKVLDVDGISYGSLQEFYDAVMVGSWYYGGEFRLNRT